MWFKSSVRVKEGRIRFLINLPKYGADGDGGGVGGGEEEQWGLKPVSHQTLKIDSDSFATLFLKPESNISGTVFSTILSG